MRSECFVRGSVLAGDRAPSGDVSIRSTDTSSWPRTCDSPPTAPTAETSSGEKHTRSGLYRTYCCLKSSCWTSRVCDPIGASWESRDTSVRVSTLLCLVQKCSSNIALHHLFMVRGRGITAAEWQLWFGFKPALRRYFTDICRDTVQIIKCTVFLF